MTEQREPTGHDATTVYEIRLRGTSPEPLKRQFPMATVTTTRTETVLLRQVERPDDLDVLIEQLLSMGLVLTEVHELLPPSPRTTPTTGAESS
jgi:hypothetical protein